PDRGRRPRRSGGVGEGGAAHGARRDDDRAALRGPARAVSAGAPVRFPVGAGVGLEDLSAAPHALLARLREAEPVSWLPALDGWLVTRRDLALGVMRDTDTFTVDDPRFSTRR